MILIGLFLKTFESISTPHTGLPTWGGVRGISLTSTRYAMFC